MTCRRPTSRGSSLIELLAASLIVSLVVSGSTQLLLAALAQSARASHLAAATWLAREKMEELTLPARATDPELGSDVVSLRSFGARTLFQRTWRIERRPHGQLLLTVTASAGRPFPGKVSLAALVAKRGRTNR